jgi:hypothetical protein
MTCGSCTSGARNACVRSCSEMCGGACGAQSDVLVVTGDARHIALFEKSRKRLMLVPMDDEHIYYTPEQLAKALRALASENGQCTILLVAEAQDMNVLKSAIPSELNDYVETRACTGHASYSEDEALLCFIKRVEQLFWPVPEAMGETSLKEYR